MYVLLVFQNFGQYDICSLVFALYVSCNSIRNHSSAVLLRQRKLREIFDLSSLNDLCVIWGTTFNSAAHFMMIFRGNL